MSNEIKSKFDKCDSREVRLIKYILHESGIINYDIIILNQLFHLIYNYVTKILEDALSYSRHANKEEIDKRDISLALAFYKEKHFISRKVNLEFAHERNIIPLPEIKHQDGLRLPAEKYCLSSASYRLIRKRERNPLQEYNQKASLLISAYNPNYSRTLIKEPNRMSNFGPQTIVFKPNLKMNINQNTENQYPYTKKRRIY